MSGCFPLFSFYSLSDAMTVILMSKIPLCSAQFNE